MNTLHLGRAAGTLLAAIALCLPATAQDARKPITFVVPYAAGGGTDIVARTLGEQMSKALGQTVIIENKPGAGGNLGTNLVAKALPDGQTVLVTLTQSALTNQFLYQKLSFDPRKELGFVSQIASAPLLLLVPASSSATSVKELQQTLRTSKAQANCGSWGAGSYPHLACAHMGSSWKTEITHVAYKGEAPMLLDLVGGQLGFAIASALSAKPYLETGRLRALAVTGEQRMATLPNVPTFTEAGFPDAEYRMLGWIGLLVPLATPAPVVERLQQAAQQALKTPELSKRLEALGMVPIGNTADEFRRNYLADWPVWERLVKVSGATLD
jgi:tripartite-type tricarboxylate transporter receptor subunit TctC